MNEMKRAIKWAQDLVKDTDECLPRCSEALKRELLEQKVFAEVAITALQEKLEREKGCEWCKDEAQSHKYWICWGCKPSFCPSCGKQLKGCGD